MSSVPTLTVIPWNGHTSAFTSTFDDGTIDHISFVAPELESRGMRGTFFLHGRGLSRGISAWRRLDSLGHEIGNHSEHHLHPGNLSKDSTIKEIVNFKSLLEDTLGIKIFTYAYPYCETNGYAKEVVQDNHFIARICNGHDIFWQKNRDYALLGSHGAQNKSDISTYKTAIDNSIANKSWYVALFHTIVDDNTKDPDWLAVSKTTFKSILDYVASKDIWVETFKTVGAYMVAGDTLSKTEFSGSESYTMVWTVPKNMPSNIPVKVIITHDKPILVEQNGKVISSTDGTYVIDFAIGKLLVKENQTSILKISTHNMNGQVGIPQVYDIRGRRTYFGSTNDISSGTFILKYPKASKLKVKFLN